MFLYICKHLYSFLHVLYLQVLYLTISGPGRPRIAIDRRQLKEFHSKGYTATKMAKHFACSKVSGL